LSTKIPPNLFSDCNYRYHLRMSNLETIHLSHLPSTLPIHVALYRDLQNASFLREQLLAGNSEFEYAFIDASMVCQLIIQIGLDLMQP
jgi:hypothetical protein